MTLRVLRQRYLAATFFCLSLSFPESVALGSPFTEGERLIYDIDWLGTTVGTGTLEVVSREQDQERDIFRVVSTARSNGLLSYLFPVEDRIESTVDAGGFFSYGIRIKQRHGPRRVQKEIRFNYDKSEASITYKGKTRVYPIPFHVQDSLSCLYFLRTLEELPAGLSVSMNVYDNKKTWQVEVQAVGYETVTVPMGTFETVKIHAWLEYEGVLMNKGDIYIWLTRDEHRIPILMKGNAAIGSVTVSLTKGLPETFSRK